MTRFRYAPTPSRPLHLGNGVAALIGWAVARACEGTFIVRIEDIDRARCSRAFEDAALADLRWLGIDWDEGPDVGGPVGPYRQSERIERYDDVIAQLLESDAGYLCRCSRAEIRRAQVAPHFAGAGGSERPYPGTCRPAAPRIQGHATGTGESEETAEASRAAAGPTAAPATSASPRGGARLDVSRLLDHAVVHWVDAALGDCQEDVRATCGDVLLGRPGSPTYQLACVADDRSMGVTHVVRGRDLSGSTGRQHLIHRYLTHLDGLPDSAPAFAHHPLIVDEAGRKLSKRDGDTSLSTLRRDGTSAPRISATLGRTIGLFGPQIAAATAQDWIDAIAGGHAPGAVWDHLRALPWHDGRL